MPAPRRGRHAYTVALNHRCDELRYDAIGIGAGAGAALRGKEGIWNIVAWSGADKVVDGRHRYKAANGAPHDPEMLISLDPDLGS